MIDNLGVSGQRLLSEAERIAGELGHNHLGVEHLFLGVVELQDKNVERRFQAAGCDVAQVAREIRERSGPAQSGGGERGLMTPRAQRVLESAAREAAALDSANVEFPHVLIALLTETTCLPTRVLENKGADVAALAANLREMLRKGEFNADAYAIRNVIDTAAGKVPGEEGPVSALDELGRDLTEEARQGELHAAIGREKDLLELIKILSGKKTPNAMVVGEAGVGKTALVRGLAVEIVEGDVPPNLRKAVIRSIEVGSLVAGTQYRGAFEAKMQKLVREAEEDRNIILFIDEIHMLMGAGAAGASDTVDAANMLKPALSGGKIRMIGATTEDEYQRHIAKDSALKRRFGLVRLKEPSPEDTLQILAGLHERYETFHDVSVTDAALAACVELSARHMPSRQQPDKALDVLDKTCSEKRLRAFYGYTDLGELSAAERRAIFEGASERAAVEGTLVIDVEDVNRSVAAMTGVPVGTLTRSDADRLLGLEEQMRKRVMGQDHALAELAKAVIMARAGIESTKRPVGAFLFLGPTGTGKTELAKTVAEALFDDEDKMVRIDMAECYDRHAISRLIGSPPGYVDSERGGTLTEGMRKNPYTVVLLDEVEKADPAVHKLLMSMMDEGHITDALGRKVDCRNAIIIMTSNVGSADIAGKNPFGFPSSLLDSDESLTKEDVRLAVTKALGRAFVPEFLNRFDEIVIFQPLAKDTLGQIARKMLGRLAVPVEADDKVLKFLVDHDFNPAMGARPLRRTIQNLVVEPLAIEVVRGAIARDQGVRLVLREGAIAFAKPGGGAKGKAGGGGARRGKTGAAVGEARSGKTKGAGSRASKGDRPQRRDPAGPPSPEEGT